MEPHRVGGGEISGGDRTVSIDASGSWNELSSIRRRRLSSPSPSAFLTPAFDACATATLSSSGIGGGADSSLDLDPSLLRYTRFRPHLSPSDSSDLRSTSTRRRLLQLRSSLSSFPSSSAEGGCCFVSPLSPIDNLPPGRSLPVHMTPLTMQVGEDVVVMDGVLVSDAETTSRRSLHRTEACRAWDENGICRYGSKCQFAHGKEELRGGRRSVKQASEVPAMRSGRSRTQFGSILPSAASSYAVFGSLLPSAASSYAVYDAAAGVTTRNVAPPAAINNHLTADADYQRLIIPAPNQASPAASAGAMAAPSTAEADCKQQTTPLSSPQSTEPSFQWPMTEAEDDQISRILYGPSQRRRLPVFTQFCPE
ncbi:unnamed protein product [Musa acuminata subsp. malaccensis]|uniref:(wild Malaysian banana) hypothetical protein n=1 Tax=Musa acuminata subsp. malaccensis TaxID=214687 RepID=A0A804I0Y1_MUSAM|nr:PREDICTED: tristetraprolin-like [Musa acuminata subsp. malaccensis]XP_018678076.1 PREDICTED: tristetraprolin-like [Musa acuminata subsp. malaccensis]XP_018678077.1 PREDICTED: tristetraprolin-like [Musa acuminata subsp. malaccensis]XP_018678078.1 PREDICTED: tristetraprolin-like [Musa acuminata subsp. malaccensis]XP_018678079.1 PREDICTED: tristetraprolin-like [Musa acuminata subsp. malaccensis]CAG1861553.1 unnamed protein product [Musa acuminata subsp. malaccensis]